MFHLWTLCVWFASLCQQHLSLHRADCKIKSDIIIFKFISCVGMYLVEDTWGRPLHEYRLSGPSAVLCQCFWLFYHSMMLILSFWICIQLLILDDSIYVHRIHLKWFYKVINYLNAWWKYTFVHCSMLDTCQSWPISFNSWNGSSDLGWADCNGAGTFGVVCLLSSSNLESSLPLWQCATLNTSNPNSLRLKGLKRPKIICAFDAVFIDCTNITSDLHWQA